MKNFGFFALFAMVAVFFAADTKACDSLAEVILPFCHFTILPFCHFTILPFYHFTILPFCHFTIFTILLRLVRILQPFTHFAIAWFFQSNFTNHLL
jgi:hypothetical protein